MEIPKGGVEVQVWLCPVGSLRDLEQEKIADLRPRLNSTKYRRPYPSQKGYIRRTKAKAESLRRRARKLRESGKTAPEIARRMGITTGMVYYYLRD